MRKGDEKEEKERGMKKEGKLSDQEKLKCNNKQTT